MSRECIGYVTEAKLESMLDEWGRDYRIDYIQLLGHQGKNALYDLIRFRGRIPTSTGYKPEPINKEADLIEDSVRRLYSINPKAATCLRLLYCSRGSVQMKSEIAGESLGENVSKATFKTMVRMGQMFILGEMNANAAA